MRTKEDGNGRRKTSARGTKGKTLGEKKKKLKKSQSLTDDDENEDDRFFESGDEINEYEDVMGMDDITNGNLEDMNASLIGVPSQTDEGNTKDVPVDSNKGI